MADNVVDVATVKVGPDTSGFRRELRAKLKGVDETVDITANVDVDTSKASTTLARWRAQQEANGIDIRANVDTKALNSAFRVVTSTLKNLGIAGALSAALISSTQAAVALGGALVQASGAAWILPGALAATGAALGTVLIGMEGIKNAFEAAAGPATRLRDAVADTFESRLAPAVQNVANLIPQLQNGFTGIASALSGVATRFTAMLAGAQQVSNLNNILFSTRDILGNLSKPIADLGAGLLSIFSTTAGKVAQMTNGVGELAVRFREWANSAQGVADINRWIDNGVQALKNLGALLSDVGGILKSIGQAFSAVGANITGVFGQAASELNQFFKSAEGQDILQSVARTIVTLANTFRQVLGTALRELGPAIISIMPAIQELVRWIGAALSDALVVVGPLLNGLATAISAMSPFLAPLAVGIGAVVMGFKAWNAVVPLVVNGFNAIKVAFATNPFGAIATAILMLVPIIVNNWDHIKSFLISTWNLIKSVATTVWNAVKNFFVNTWNTIRNTAVNVWNGIRSFVVGVWNTLKSAASNTWNGIKNVVSSVLNGISSFFRSAWNGMRNFVVSAWNGIKNGVSNGINAVLGFVRGLPGKILSALGNLGGLLLDAGKAIINGLLNGLKAAIGGVWDFVSGIAGKIADLKGPLPYDRKLLIPAGEAIMFGLRKGLAENFSPVEQLVSGMGPKLANAFADPGNMRVNWQGLTKGLPEVLRSMVTQVVSAVTAMNQALSSVSIAPNVGVARTGTVRPPVAATWSAPMPSVADSANQSPARASGTNATASAVDYESLARAVASAMDGLRVDMSPDGLAKLVNKSNTRKARRN